MGSKGMRYGAQFFPPNFLRAISNGRFKEGTRWKGRMKCCIHLYPLVSSNMTGILLLFHSEGWWFPINDSQASVTFCTHGLLVFSGPRLVMKHILGSEIPDLFLWNCHFLNGFWFPFTPPRCFRSPQDVFFFPQTKSVQFLDQRDEFVTSIDCWIFPMFHSIFFRKGTLPEGTSSGRSQAWRDQEHGDLQKKYDVNPWYFSRFYHDENMNDLIWYIYFFILI